MTYNEAFWGSRQTSSKGMRYNVRKIWHFYRRRSDWMSRSTDIFSICRAGLQNWDEATTETPKNSECCADCRRIWNKLKHEGKIC